jgi:hypothetical protein
MLLSRYQFTIGQLVTVIVFSGFLFWMIRETGGTAVVLMFPAIDGVVLARTRAAGVERTTLYRCLVLVGCGIVYCTYFYFFPDPSAVSSGVRTFIGSLVYVTASVWIVVVTRLGRLISKLWLAVVMGRSYQMPPTDDSCGPIAWRGFGDGLEPRARGWEPLHPKQDAGWLRGD